MLFEPKEKVICILDNTKFGVMYAVCEGSVVYNLSKQNPFMIECLLDKKINHVSFDPQKKLPIFSSLYNKNKKDDKIYYLKQKGDDVEELVIDIIPSDVRVINISSSCGTGVFFHLGFLNFFYFNFILIFFLNFLFFFILNFIISILILF